MYVSLVLKELANNSRLVGIEIGNIKTKGLNMYIIRKAIVNALQFFRK